MKVIAVLGDYYHDGEVLKESLDCVLSKIEGVKVDYVKRDKLVNFLREYPDLVILGSENRLNPNEGSKEKMDV